MSLRPPSLVSRLRHPLKLEFLVGFYLLILAGVILVPALLYIESSIAEALVNQKVEEIEAVDQNVVQQLSAQIESAEGSIQRYAHLLSTAIRPATPEYVAEFDRLVQRDTDGSWRSKRSTFQPETEAGIWVPPNALLNDDMKSFYIQAKGLTEQFGSGAFNHTFVNTWILPDTNGEVIFFPDGPEFIYQATSDQDYRQTDWVNLVRPEVNPEGDIAWTPTSFDPVPSLWMISVIAPYSFQGEWAGSVGHDVTVSNLLRYSGQLSRMKGSRFFILTYDGTLLISDRYQAQIEASQGTFTIREADEPELIPILPELMAHLARIPAGEVMRMETESDLLIASRIEGSGWIVVNVIPRASIIELIRQPFSILRWIVLLALGVTLIASILSVSRDGQQRRERERAIRELNIQLKQEVSERTQELERRVTQIATGAEIGRAMTALLDPNQLTAQLVERIRERFNFYFVGLYLLDGQAQHLLLHQGSGEVGHQLKEMRHRLLIDEHSMVGWVGLHHEPRIASQAREDPVRFANPLLPDTYSEIALPLRVGNRLLGVLDIQSTRVAAFDESDVIALQSMTDQIAAALENARLFQQTQNALKQSEGLYQAVASITGSTHVPAICQSLIDHLNILVQADRIFILLVDHIQQQIVFSLGHGDFADDRLPESYNELMAGRSGTVSRTRQPILFPSADDEPEVPHAGRAAATVESLIVVPLTLKGQVLGTITITNRVDQRRFTQQDVDLLMALTTHASTAIENIRLFEETQVANAALSRQALRLQTSSQVGYQVTSILDLDALLEQVVALIAAHFDYYFVGVWLLTPQEEALELRGVAGRATQSWQAQSLRVPMDASVSLIVEVCKSGHYRLVDRVEEEPNYLAMVEFAETRSELALPLRRGQRIIGVLDIGGDQPAAFGAEDALVLQTLADQIAVAIHNATLFDITQRAHHAAEALRAVSHVLNSSLDRERVLLLILEELAKIVNYDSALLMLFSDGTLKPVAYRSSQEHQEQAQSYPLQIDNFPHIQEVLREHIPLVVADTAMDSRWLHRPESEYIRCWMGVPLVIQDQVVGLLNLNKKEPHFYTQYHTALAVTFANQATIAIEN
nr:GAF domain-containing protein [Ardenticatenales bacterium]